MSKVPHSVQAPVEQIKVSPIRVGYIPTCMQHHPPQDVPQLVGYSRTETRNPATQPQSDGSNNNAVAGWQDISNY